jgi:diguanylate cyclase (GGDEF)-like protein
MDGNAVVLKGDLGNPTILGLRATGAAVGDMALLERLPRSASVVALDGFSLWTLTREVLYLYVSQSPDFSMHLLHMLSARIRGSDGERQRSVLREREAGRKLEGMEHKANADALTGLFNRGFLEELVAREIRRAEADSAPVGMIMVDIDHFKKINDTFGREAGDLALKALGALLRKSARPSDFACRYGGEEFVIVAPGAAISVMERLAGRLRAAYAETVAAFEGKEIRANLSAGVACYPKRGASGA